jgi:hypothetical protein
LIPTKQFSSLILKKKNKHGNPGPVDLDPVFSYLALTANIEVMIFCLLVLHIMTSFSHIKALSPLYSFCGLLGFPFLNFDKQENRERSTKHYMLEMYIFKKLDYLWAKWGEQFFLKFL